MASRGGLVGIARMEPETNSALIRRPPSAVDAARSASQRILDGIVEDTLAVVQDKVSVTEGRSEAAQEAFLEGVKLLRKAHRAAFSVEDVADLRSFAWKVNQASDAVSTWLKGALSQGTQGYLGYYLKRGEFPRHLCLWLAQDVSRIVRSQLIYDAERFAGVSLRPETQQLLTQSSQRDELVRLNRLLIQDAYPSEIPTKPRAQHATDELWLRLYRQAFAKFLTAAEMGHPRAQFKVGEMYMLGEGVGANSMDCAKWYYKAVAQGDELARFALASNLATGCGMGKNIDAAAKLLLGRDPDSLILDPPCSSDCENKQFEAYEHLLGFAGFASEVAWDLLAGQQDIAGLTTWWRVLAAGGDWYARSRLSCSPQLDAATMDQLINEAKSAGPKRGCGNSLYNYREAFFRLGCCYEEGVGVPRDDAKARALYGLALQIEWEGGVLGGYHAELYYRLGMLCLLGRGGPRDLSAAYVFFSVTNASNFEGLAQGFAQVRAIASPEELASGEAMLKAWGDDTDDRISAGAYLEDED